MMNDFNKINDNSKMMEFIKVYLLDSELSAEIINHPRFDSIIWKLSSILRRAGVNPFSKEAIALLKSIVVIQKDGSIVIFDNIPINSSVNSVKYYYDYGDMKLRRINCSVNQDGEEVSTINTYADDGLEECLLVEQKCLDCSKYYSRTTRVPDRIDMVLLERIREIEGKKEVLSSMYQIRFLCAAYEDLGPSADDIDPLDKVGFSILGVPKIYRDLDEDEEKIIEECDGEIFPLDDINRAEQFASYVETNKFYGRTRNYEDAVARYLSVDNDYSDEKQY